MLLAEVPEQPASASTWRLCEGFHWRLHVHHRTRHTRGFTLSIVRESNFSDVKIGVQVRLLSDHFRKPVRNLMLASKEPFAYERDVTVLLPASLVSKSAKICPIAVPLGGFVLAVSLDIQECFIEVENLSGRTSYSFTRSEVVERFSDSYSTERSITWLEETEPHSEPAQQNVRFITTDSQTEKDDDLVSATVPYNLSNLLESCHHGEAGDVQARDKMFSDVILNVGSSVNTRAFNLHRCVLALASPVFRAMLASDMIERRTGVVTLPNFTPSAVDVAVRHIYGSPVNVFQHAFELYHFAHQFDIVSLRHTTRRSILEKLDLRNCAHVLRFGVAFRDEELVNIARSFIATRFTEIVWDDVAAREMNHIPRDTFLRLLEDDTIKATEFEILLVAMRWISFNNGAGSQDVLRRIRWGLITVENLDLTEVLDLSPFPSEQAVVDTSESKVKSIEEDARREPTRRRWVGKPNAKVWVPLISRPPTAFFPTTRWMKEDKKRKTRRDVRGEPSRQFESSFGCSNLRWTFRVKLEDCDTTSCYGSRLSASLWLEEGDDGRVWTEDGRDPLPVRVLANLMVWNHLGGQLHVVPIDVVFRSAGWGNGWCVRDLLDGGKHRLPDYGEAVQVAVEIQKIVRV